LGDPKLLASHWILYKTLCKYLFDIILRIFILYECNSVSIEQ